MGSACVCRRRMFHGTWLQQAYFFLCLNTLALIYLFGAESLSLILQTVDCGRQSNQLMSGEKRILLVQQSNKIRSVEAVVINSYWDSIPSCKQLIAENCFFPADSRLLFVWRMDSKFLAALRESLLIALSTHHVHKNRCNQLLYLMQGRGICVLWGLNCVLLKCLQNSPLLLTCELFRPLITNQLIQLLVNQLPFVTIVVWDLACQ